MVNSKATLVVERPKCSRWARQTEPSCDCSPMSSARAVWTLFSPRRWAWRSSSASQSQQENFQSWIIVLSESTAHALGGKQNVFSAYSTSMCSYFWQHCHDCFPHKVQKEFIHLAAKADRWKIILILTDHYSSSFSRCQGTCAFTFVFSCLLFVSLTLTIRFHRHPLTSFHPVR